MTKDPAQPQSDRQRRSPRLGQHDREAALLRGGSRAKVVVLNLSQAGIMGECAAPLAPDERVDIVLDNREPVRATTRWVEGRRFGAVFDEPLPFEALLPPRGRGFQAAQTKTDRTAVDAPAIVRVDGVPVEARIRNVSTRGMLIDTAVRLPTQQVVEIVVADWIARGVVAWSRDGSAGVRLEKALSEEQTLDLVMARRTTA